MRALSARGSYDTAATVLIRNRSLDGVPGYHVVTLIVMDDGTAVLVNRGFIPRARRPAPRSAARPRRHGRGHRPGTADAGRACSGSDPDEGTLTEAHRIDVARLAE